MFAEDYLELLLRKNFITPEKGDELYELIAPMPKSIPADVFAERLVEQEILTAPLARALLQQLLSDGPPVSPVTPSREPTPTPTPTSTSTAESFFPPPPPPPSSRPVEQGTLARGPEQPTEAPATESIPDAILGKAESQLPGRRFSQKKKKSNNTWDTKLILFGGAGLLVLLLASVFLTGSLTRRGADKLLEKGNQAFQRGEASQAIIDYTEYLKKYPNHSGISTARIRLALSRIRLLVDTRSDWLETFDTTIKEIGTVENEPAFFEESKAELAVLLPKIAAGLAEQAEEKKSVQHAECSEKMLQLIEKLLPRSLRPFDRMAEIQVRIGQVRKQLVRDDLLRDSESRLQAALTESAQDTASVDRCYEIVDAILEHYPELEKETRLRNMLHHISQSEHKAIRPLSIEPPSKEGEGEASVSTDCRELASLFYRTSRAAAKPTDEIRLTDHVLVRAAGTLFGLRASDGIPVWKKPLPSDPSTDPLHPVSRSGRILYATKTTPEEPDRALLLDSDRGSVELLDASTGKTLWRWALGEPLLFAENIVLTSDRRIVLAGTTPSGKLLILTLDRNDGAGEHRIEAMQLPQKVDSAPVIDATGRRVYQFAARDTLYVISPNEPTNNRSVYIGQKPSSIRVPPIVMGSNLLLVLQKKADECELVVCRPDASGEESPSPGFAVTGLVDTPPVVSGNFVAVVSDNGEIYLLENTNDRARPIRQVARGSSGDSLRQRAVRFIALDEKNIWIADHQLTRYELQPSQGRLLPQNALQKNIATLSRPFSSGGVLYHTFYRSGQRGGGNESIEPGEACIGAVSLKDRSLCWETEPAETILQEPRNVPGRGTLVATSGGRIFSIDPAREAGPSFSGDPAMMMRPDAFGGVPLGNVIPIPGGLEAWVPRIGAVSEKRRTVENRLLLFCDPKASAATRFRSLHLPASLVASPILFHDKLLVPLKNGRIILVDPQSGDSAAAPFVSDRAPNESPFWGTPVLSSDGMTVLVADHRADRDGKHKLYKIILEGEEDEKKLVAPNPISLERPPVANVASLGKDIVLVDDRMMLRTFRENGDTTEQKLTSPLAWGPCTVGDTVLWSTSDSNLHAISAEGTVLSASLSIPVGKPFVDDGGVLLNSADGILWKIEVNGLKTVFKKETGLRPCVGPMKIDGTILLSCRDGSVYAVESP